MSDEYKIKLIKIARELDQIIKNKNMFEGTLDFEQEYNSKVNYLIGYIMALESELK